MNATSPCDGYQDELAELALGALTGRIRAEVLAHVEACPRCAEEMEELSRTADLLLQVAPEVEPPAGFEVRLLERLGEPRQTAARPRRRIRQRLRTTRARAVLVAASTVAIAGAGAGIGLTVASASAPAPAPVLQATLLATDGHTAVGRVVASPGSPPWLFMVVKPGHLSGRVTCRVGLADGRWVTVGTFSLAEGYGSWSARLWVSVPSLRTAELVSPQGVVVAMATFQ